MSDKKNIQFTDNSNIQNPANYANVTVNVTAVLDSWRVSMFSFEWLLPDGKVRSLRELPEKEQEKRERVEEKIAKGIALEKPILGLGMEENIEIGSGRAEFLTAAAHGLTEIEVLVPKSLEKDFERFLVGYVAPPKRKKAKRGRKKAESGNVLFYVLIAVALLAALSYAVSESSRGNVSQLSREKARLVASEIIEYSNTMSNAVAQLRLRGVKDSNLCFDDSAWGASNYNHAGCSDNINKIFHTQGAGMIWSQPPSEAMESTATPDNLWHIYGNNEIDQVGTTCGGAACADLILVVDELNEETCIQINDLIDIENPGGVPPTDSDMGETRYIGAFGYAYTIGGEAGGEPLQGQTSGCFRRLSNNEYVFYKVLIAR